MKKVFLSIIACIIVNISVGQVNKNAGSHPLPQKTRIPWTKNTVKLLSQKEQNFKYGPIEIYQNSEPNGVMMPFEVYIDTLLFKKFVDKLISDSIVNKNYSTRFVIHYPGSPSGSIADFKWKNPLIIALEFGRDIYKYVWCPYFDGHTAFTDKVSETFTSLMESQMNYVLYHEAQHIIHYRKNVKLITAEKLATQAEGPYYKEFGKIIRIRFLNDANYGFIRYSERQIQASGYD